MITILVGNSFSKFSSDIPPEDYAKVKAALTYKDSEVAKEKSRIFMQMQRAKNMGNNRMYYGMKAQLAELPPEEVCWLHKNSFPTGHLQIVREVLGKTRILDKREVPTPYLTLRWENRPPPMRYYQEEMLAIAEENERGVFEAAVGSGKSRVITEIIKQRCVNTVIIVPSLVLQEQLFRTLELAFGSGKVGVYNASSVKSGKKLKPIRICNVQSIGALQKKKQADKLLSDVDLLILDEVHHSGSKTYTDLLPIIGNIYYRYGFTGTFLRNDSKTLDMHGFLSQKLYEYSPKRATEEGFLTPVTYISHSILARPHRNYQREYDLNYCGNPALLRKILEIVKNTEKDEQILILVKRKEKSGAIISEFLRKEGFDNSYISGDNDKEDVNNIIEKFNNKQVRILVGSQVVGEGVDVHSTTTLILATGGKSEIEFVQACGRAVRLSDDKERAHIHDFSFDGSFYLQSHAETRLAIFRRNFSGNVQERD